MPPRLVPFKKGRVKTGGRKPGVQNKTTRVLRDAILDAAAVVGENGKGRNGLLGYLVRLARKHPQSYVHLIAKVLPMQVTGEGGGPLRMITVNFSAADAAQAYQDTLKQVNS